MQLIFALLRSLTPGFPVGMAKPKPGVNSRETSIS